MADHRLLAFYNQQAPTDDGFWWHDIVQRWDDARLEYVHSYIQWLFPLEERSGANPSGPVLDAVTRHAFATSAELQERVRQSWMRMMEFYGWEVTPAATLASGEGLEQRLHDWYSPGNHNHLRLTRIVRSLGLLGLPQEAERTRHALLTLTAERPGGATPQTVVFWREA